MERQDRGFVSIGGVASELKVSSTMVRRYEREGLIPRGQRVDGGRFRIWPAEEVDDMPRHIAERRAERKEAQAAA